MGEVLSLVVAILIVGVLVWAIRALPIIDEQFKQVAIVILIVVLAIYAILVIARLAGVAVPALK